MSPSEQHWMEQAEYDLETARAMLRSGRYLYVLFCCQQAIEKALKSLIVKKTGELPPRLHDLMKLAKAADIKPADLQIVFLRELSAYYIQSRYPEEIEDMSQQTTRTIASDALKKTEELLQWLKSARI